MLMAQPSVHLNTLRKRILSGGIDHTKTPIYLQSLVPEVLELTWIFLSLVSVPRAQRIPTLKEQVRDLKLESASMALLAYPVLQAADILMVKGDLVPVGKDQLSHIELTREIARRFNDSFRPVFPVPEGLVGGGPTLPRPRGARRRGAHAARPRRQSEDGQVARQRHLPHRRPRDGGAEGDDDVHGSDADPHHRPRPCQGQPRVRIPRRVSPGKR